MFICIVHLLRRVVALILLLTSRLRSRRAKRSSSPPSSCPPSLLIALGLLYPAINTIYSSFKDNTAAAFVGLDNYQTSSPTTSSSRCCATPRCGWSSSRSWPRSSGSIYAVLVDRARFEKFAKALIFLPMAISLVGASIIWKFVYDYRDDRERRRSGWPTRSSSRWASTPTSSCSTSRGTTCS